jgi:uncharacterized surface protein with fasciclin (FAS1) repeats
MQYSIRSHTFVNKYTVLAVLYVIFVVALFGTHSLLANDTDKVETANKDIVDIASSSKDFQTLVAAVKAAGLVETLKGDGPFTVFAPTDKAFAALPNGTVENLLKPENRELLVQILTFHVVSGKVTSDNLLRLGNAKTVNGSSLPFGLRIGEANIIKTDIEASNGIIHVIDRVLIPNAPAMSDAVAPKNGAASIIRTAIARGVPLYNSGQTAACASVYEVAALAILELGDDIPGDASKALSNALRKMEHSHNGSERAWIMREGLDNALVAMSPVRMMD